MKLKVNLSIEEKRIRMKPKIRHHQWKSHRFSVNRIIAKKKGSISPRNCTQSEIRHRIRTCFRITAAYRHAVTVSMLQRHKNNAITKNYILTDSLEKAVQCSTRYDTTRHRYQCRRLQSMPCRHPYSNRTEEGQNGMESMERESKNSRKNVA